MGCGGFSNISLGFCIVVWGHGHPPLILDLVKMCFFLMGIPLLGESIGHTVVVVFWGGPEAIPSQNRCSDISHEESPMMVG